MSLKQIVNTPDLWGALKSKLEEDLAQVHLEMERAEGDERLYLQGSARTLRKLLQLKERTNSKDTKNGQ